MKSQTRIILLVFMSTFYSSHFSYAQCDWFYNVFGGSSADGVTDITSDASGNTYITGFFNSNVTLGNSSLSSSGGEDVFLAKIDASGDVIWAVEAGSSLDDRATGVVVDDLGYIYIVGTYDDDITFESILKSNAGGSDVFLAKYSSSGVLQWVTTAGSSNDESAVGLGTYNNIVYFAGSQSSATFNNTSAGSSSLSGSPYNYIVSYDANGTVQSLEKLSSSGSLTAQDLAVDGSGNVYVTGSFYSSITIGLNSYNTNGNGDIFIAKYSGTTLQPIWSKAAGSSSDDKGTHLTVDNSDNIYLGGSFYSTITFDSQSTTSVGNDDAFLAKFNSTGTAQFITNIGGASCCENSLALTYDQFNDRIFFIAYIQSYDYQYGGLTINFDDYSSTKLFEIQTSGALEQVVNYPANSSSSYAVTPHMAVNTMGHLIVTSTSNGAWFNSQQVQTNNSSDDIFYFKLDDLSNLLFVEEPNLCLVAIDPTTKKNTIYWDDNQDAAVATYNIYKENIIGEYELIHSEAANGGGNYVDTNSEPRERAATYIITAVDACNEETDIENYYGITTMHLIMYEGPNDTWSLHWSDYSSDEDDNLYYRILRGTSENDLAPYDSIQQSLSNTYTDLTPPAGDVYYSIEAVIDLDCAPSGINPSSNKVANTELFVSTKHNLNEYDLHIFPIPATDQINITHENSDVNITQVYITDNFGRINKTITVNSHSVSFDVSALNPGLYSSIIALDNGKSIARKFTVR